jgi:polyprenyl-phospho-N-acetylgalactosaminyl synthase
MSIYVIIPVYNESKVIDTLLKFKQFSNYKLVVVNDGSTDLPSFDRLYIPVVVITHAVNLGQGAALQTGMEYAKNKGAEIVVHFDADGQHNCDDIAKIIAPVISKETDSVIGSRFLKGKSESNSSAVPLKKKIVLEVARLAQFIFSGILLSDSQNGLRALSKNAYTRLVITENRMAHAIEIIQLLKKNKIRILEVPVNIVYTDYSNKKGQKLINGVFIVLRLIANKVINNISLFLLIITAIIVAVFFYLDIPKTPIIITVSISCIYLGNLWWIMLYKRSKEKLVNKTNSIRQEALKRAQEFNLLGNKIDTI